MFSIYADDNLIYDATLEETAIGKGSGSLEVNKSGSFTFSLYPDHAYYDALADLTTIIRVYRDDTLIFRGRILKHIDGFYRERVFTCEGELSFLLDSNQRAWTFTGSPEALFTQFITVHNSQVEEAKRFTVGSVTVTDPNDYIARSNSSYESTYKNLNDLIESLGGYIVFTEGSGGARVINWLVDIETVSDQSIAFGENLLDLTKQKSSDSIITALIPLGARVENQSSETEVRVTIESVNGGVDYIYDETAVNTYGWIYDSHTWEDVTVPANLLTKARAYLADLINPLSTIEVSAIDLSAIDTDINAFVCGTYVPISSPPHNLEANYLLTKQTFDLLKPENNKITLGHTFTTFTGSAVGANTSQIKSEVSDLSAGVSAQLSAVNQVLAQLDQKVTGSGWLDCELSPFWTASQTVQYKEVNDQIFIRGAVRPTEAYTSGTTEVLIAAGIPEAYRPDYNITFVIAAAGTLTWICTITTLGTITISRYGSGGTYATITTDTVLSFAVSYSL